VAVEFQIFKILFLLSSVFAISRTLLNTLNVSFFELTAGCCMSFYSIVICYNTFSVVLIFYISYTSSGVDYVELLLRFLFTAVFR